MYLRISDNDRPTSMVFAGPSDSNISDTGEFIIWNNSGFCTLSNGHTMPAALRHCVIPQRVYKRST